MKLQSVLLGRGELEEEGEGGGVQVGNGGSGKPTYISQIFDLM